MCGKCRYCQTGRPQLCDQAAKAAYTLPDGTVRTKDQQGKPLNIFSGCGVMAEFATLHSDNVVNAKTEENVVKAVRKLTGGGADYAFECVGYGEIVAQAYGVLRKGGTAVVVGVASQKDTTTVRTASLTFEEKTLTGSYFGSARPREDFPRLLALYRNKRLKLDELITRSYRIDEAPQAFADLASGKNARGVIVFG